MVVMVVVVLVVWVAMVAVVVAGGVTVGSLIQYQTAEFARQ